MSTKDLWEEITSKPKWYAGLRTLGGSFHTAQSANNLKLRFKQGKLSMKLITDIFRQCGYVRTPEKWDRRG